MMCRAFPIALTALCLVFAAFAVEQAAAQGDNPTATADDEARPAESKRRTLLDTVMDGGVIGVLLILLSLVATGLIVLHAVRIRKPVLVPHIVGLDEALRQKNVAKATAIIEEQPQRSLLGNVVLAGLERYRNSEFGAIEYRAAVEEAGEEETGRLYRMTDWLGLIGSVAPMLGLTGTVLGMIEAFNEIAVSGGTATPDELAGGIGKALVTTLLGLVVAIPSMIAYSFFRNRIDSIIAETGSHVEQMLTPLSQTARPATAAAGKPRGKQSAATAARTAAAVPPAARAEAPTE